MWKKIKVRSEMLRIFGTVGLDTNPYSLNPLCKYLYYEYLNGWLPILKKDLSDPNAIVRAMFSNAKAGLSAEAFNRLSDGEGFSLADCVDEELKKFVAEIDPNDMLTRLVGASL